MLGSLCLGQGHGLIPHSVLSKRLATMRANSDHRQRRVLTFLSTWATPRARVKVHQGAACGPQGGAIKWKGSFVSIYHKIASDSQCAVNFRIFRPELPADWIGSVLMVSWTHFPCYREIVCVRECEDVLMMWALTMLIVQACNVCYSHVVHVILRYLWMLAACASQWSSPRHPRHTLHHQSVSLENPAIIERQEIYSQERWGWRTPAELLRN